jgi:hypothetical protein
MSPTISQLSWCADLLGKEASTPELARVVAEFGLTEERSGSIVWFESVHSGLSISCRDGVIDTIQFLSSDVDGFTSFAGELPMGVAFDFSRDDVVARLGPPDHELGPRSHGGILRYDVGSCWIALVLSSRGTGLESVALESRASAASVTGLS